MSGTSSIKTKIFKNNDHAVHISSKLQKFYNEKKFFNIALIAGIDDVKLEAHRIVLCGASEYFQAFFDSSLENSKAEEVKLENIDGSTLKSILDFMYTSSIELRSDTVENILRAANHFQLRDLIAACCDFMEEQLNPSNCLGIALLAKHHGYTELHKKSLKFVYNHFEDVCTHQEFLQLNGTQLNEFLSGDDLQVASQKKLFHSLMAWYRHDEANRQKLICSLLLPHVRYALLEQNFIIENGQKLSNIHECSELMWQWLEWHLSSESRKREEKKIIFAYEGPSLGMFSFQTFYPEQNKWSLEGWPSPSVAARVSYAMLVINKKLIISGGIINGQVTKEVKCLDLQTKEWYELPSMESERYAHAMGEMNGELYVIGGYSNKFDLLRSMEKYNFSTQKWENLTPLPSKMDGIEVVVLNGFLYLSSENQYYLECYNPVTNNWTQTASKNEKSSLFALLSVNGYLYVTGGQLASKGPRWIGGKYVSPQMSTTVERYDPSINTWTVVESMKVGRSRPSCAAWNDRILACGGETVSERMTKICEEYNTKTNEWKSSAPLLDFTPGPFYTVRLSIL